MVSRVLLEDTIAAVVSPRGRGGISVIRVSGPNCLKICRNSCGFIPFNPEAHKIYFGFFRRSNGERLDQVVIAYFAAGKSFTGEETLEISCHGNPVITSEILEELIFSGARIAERGEFSYRAFMNGKVDLVQAESILTLIEADSKKATNLALRQLSGELSNKLLEIEADLIQLLANLEAGIDFSTEDIVPFSGIEIETGFNSVLENINFLLSSYKQGKLYSEGIRVALVGKPNVGKSSLLNLFLKKDRAIVSEEAGTTRDIVDGAFVHEGIKFEFVDTAGIRNSSINKIEKLGIHRSISAAAEADVIFFVYDISTGFNDDDLLAWENVKIDSSQPCYFLGNKVDLLNGKDLDLEPLTYIEQLRVFLGSKFEICKGDFFLISSQSLVQRDVVLNSLMKFFELNMSSESAVVSNARHFDLLSDANRQVLAAMNQFKKGVGEEFLTLELRSALQSILSILGKHYDDQILDKIFKEFCLGK